MKDARLRFLSVVVLSIASFMNVVAAMLTVGWWFIHEKQKGVVLRFIPFWIYLGIIGFFGLLIQVEGGEGLSYVLRLGAIALLAAWTYREFRSGEFLDVAVWVFGKKVGFELGLVAEMSIQSLRVLEEDIGRIRMALIIKGGKGWVRTLPTTLSLLLMTTLRRSDAQATLLALRGYQKGGELCPEFSRQPRDLLSGSVALAIFFLTLYLTLSV